MHSSENMDHMVFGAIKIVLSFSPRSLESNEIMICNVQSSFYSKFGLTQSDTNLPIPLKVLFGSCTDRRSISELHQSFISGQTMMLYVNLYHSTNRILPCHITLRSLNHKLNQSQEHFLLPISDCITEQRAILTIRSASVVGNAQFNGIGLLDMNRIYQGYLEEVIGFENRNESSSDTSSKSV